MRLASLLIMFRARISPFFFWHLALAALAAALAWKLSRSPVADILEVARGFQQVSTGSSAPQVETRASYHFADKASAFSGRKPLKQLITVRNLAGSKRRVPVLLSQRI